VILLAAPPLAASSGSANDITPGVLGFIVVAAMGFVLFLLLRSMNKHLRRVREVRDAGLAPGSDLASATASATASAVSPRSAGVGPTTNGAANESGTQGWPENGTDSPGRTDPADGTGGAAGR
jgi:hypothetical protein